jgi:hypothetical protein
VKARKAKIKQTNNKPHKSIKTKNGSLDKSRVTAC